MLESGNRLAQLKLKVLFIINTLNLPITNMDLTKFILENNYMDYFTLQEVVLELQEDGFVNLGQTEGKKSYTITVAGQEAINMFSDRIPKNFKLEITEILKTLQKEVKRNKNLFAHYYQRKDEDFTVILQAIEESIIIFNFSLNVPTEKLAKDIVAKWKKNPDKIYSEIINILMRP
ncbi:MAG: Uncharacterized protein XD91_1385 [Clostridiales bacterium 38_11]|nr:MAG: Uncharacterized protein XD91_1385 [Clostridiales bacterium 38_11]